MTKFDLNQPMTRRKAGKLAATGAAALAITTTLPLSTANATAPEVTGGNLLDFLAESIEDTSKEYIATNSYLHRAVTGNDRVMASELGAINLKKAARIRNFAATLSHVEPQSMLQAQAKAKAMQTARGYLAFV